MSRHEYMNKERNIRQTRDRERTLKCIVLSAEHLFAVKGFAQTSMRGLARDAGIRAATLYHYFPSKTALLLAVFRDFYGDLAALYERFEAELPPRLPLRSALRQFMAAHYAFILERPHFSSLFLFEGMRPGSPVRPRLRGITKASAAATRKIASHWPGIPRGKVVSLFLSVVGMNIFFQKTAGYLEIVAGTAVPEVERFATLAALIDTGDPETVLRKKQCRKSSCGASRSRSASPDSSFSDRNTRGNKRGLEDACSADQRS